MRKPLLVLSAVSLSVAAHAGFVIDDFSNGAVEVTTDSANVFAADSASASVLGGTRHLGQVFSGPSRRSAAAVADGSLNVSTPSGSLTKTALMYGNSVGGAVNLSGTPDWIVGPGADLSLGSNDKFKLNFLSNERDLTLTISMQHNLSGYTTYSKLIPGGQFNPFSVIIDSSNISSVIGGGASMSAFDSVHFLFNSSVAGDFELGSVEAVPEPASMAALGLGVAALLRRRKKA